MQMILLLSIFILTGCSHGSIDFQSFPNKVSVSVVESDGQIKKLGQTPLKVNSDNIFFNNGAVKLMFTKEGYRDEVVYITKPALKSDIKISTNMQEANSAKEIISNQKLEKISNKVAEAQKYSFAKNYQRAENILLNIIDEYPDISVPYDLLANIYYLSNDMNKALYYYEKAKNIAPGNTKRDYIINKLKRRTRGNSGDTQL